MPVKWCKMCRLIKPFRDFHIDRQNRNDGRQRFCKPCRKIINAKRRKKKPSA